MEFEGEGFGVGGGGEVEILHLLEGLPLVLDWGIRVLGVKAGAGLGLECGVSLKGWRRRASWFRFFFHESRRRRNTKEITLTTATPMTTITTLTLFCRS